MKKFYLSITTILLVNSVATAQTTYFQQDFSAGGTPSNYVSASPNNSQFNGLAGLSATVTNNAVQFSRSTAGGTGYMYRTSNFAGTPTSLHVQFSFEVLSSDPTVSATNAVIFYVGSGFPTGPSNPNNAETYARFAIALSSAGSGQFQVRTVPSGGGGTTSGSFSGRQTLTFAMNNSGSTLSYVSPTSSMETLPNDTYDLWVGGLKFANDQPVLTPGQSINNFKFRLNDGVGVMQFDDMLMRDISGALPVNLVSFTAKPQGNQIQLSWETTAERNADRFEVERSRDLGEFLTIGTVTARGTTDKRQYYGLLDEHPLDGANYYRLKQVDSDGRTEYSKTISAILDEQTPALELLGNPGDGQSLHIVSRNLPNADYYLTTLTGQKLNVSHQLQADGSVVLTPAQPLQPGIYLLRTDDGTTRLVRKIVVR